MDLFLLDELSLNLWLRQNMKTFKRWSAPVWKCLRPQNLETQGLIRQCIKKCLLRGITTTVRSLTEIVSGWNPNLDLMSLHHKAENTASSLQNTDRKFDGAICIVNGRNYLIYGEFDQNEIYFIGLTIDACIYQIYSVSSNHTWVYSSITTCNIIKDSTEQFSILHASTNFIKSNSLSQVLYLLCTSIMTY